MFANMEATISGKAQMLDAAPVANRKHTDVQNGTSQARLSGLEDAFRERLEYCLSGKTISDRDSPQSSPCSPSDDVEGRRQTRLMYRTLRRRQWDHVLIFKEQSRRGRPGPYYHKCFDDECVSCMWEDIPAMIYNRLLSNRGIRVEEYNAVFLQTMVGHFFKEDEDPKEKGPKYRAIESFVASPPIRMFFFIWISQAVCGQFTHLNSLQIGYLLENLQDTARNLVEQTFSGRPIEKWHGYFIEEGYETRQGSWCYFDHVMEFISCAESWRRYQVHEGFRLEWDFGDAETITEIIMAVFLHFHIMYRDGCFEADLPCQSIMDGVWETWLAKYPPSWHEDMYSPSIASPGSDLSTLFDIHDRNGIEKDDASTPTGSDLGAFTTTNKSLDGGLHKHSVWSKWQEAEEVLEGVGTGEGTWVWNIRAPVL